MCLERFCILTVLFYGHLFALVPEGYTNQTFIGKATDWKAMCALANALSSSPNNSWVCTNSSEPIINHCNWQGVTCDQYGVIGLILESNTNLTSIPQEIGLLTNLTILILDNLAVTSVPSQISDLSNLEFLDLRSNPITQLPPEIGNLTRLTYLNLDMTLIATLPSTIGNLLNLQYLIISNIKSTLSPIPTQIGLLQNLTNLFVYNTLISTVPTQIGKLRNMIALKLYNSNIQTIPTQIGQLSQLTLLIMSSNNISIIPSQIGNLNMLTMVDISNNPLIVQCLPAPWMNIQELACNAGGIIQWCNCTTRSFCSTESCISLICGDGFATDNSPGEVCDSGNNCDSNCTCLPGFEPTNPVSSDCEVADPILIWEKEPNDYPYPLNVKSTDPLIYYNDAIAPPVRIHGTAYVGDTDTFAIGIINEGSYTFTFNANQMCTADVDCISIHYIVLFTETITIDSFIFPCIPFTYYLDVGIYYLELQNDLGPPATTNNYELTIVSQDQDNFDCSSCGCMVSQAHGSSNPPGGFSSNPVMLYSTDWNTANGICSAQNRLLCSLHEICPGLQGRSPVFASNYSYLVPTSTCTGCWVDLRDGPDICSLKKLTPSPSEVGPVFCCDYQCDTRLVCNTYTSNCSNGDGCLTSSCQCDKGWQPSTPIKASCQDTNECEISSSCQNNGTCSNYPGGYFCKCDFGFIPINTSYPDLGCYVLNPCDDNNGGCQDPSGCVYVRPGISSCSCSNPLSYKLNDTHCKCLPGYNGDGIICTAINPCESNNGNCQDPDGCVYLGPGASSCKCSQSITIQISATNCTCISGYIGDGIHCIAFNPCTVNNGGCQDPSGCTYVQPGISSCSCSNPLSYKLNDTYCKCLPGYTGDGIICTAQNPCNTNNGHCQDTCIYDHPGESHCHCEDVHSYSLNSTHCGCLPGYIGDGLNCTARNPCDTNNGNCQDTCIYDLPGESHCQCMGNHSYSLNSTHCACLPGYIGDGLHCTGDCGDGIQLKEEMCDDGNTQNGDGCNSKCTLIEKGFKCPYAGHPCQAICGDGIKITPSEECDDGNLIDGDGCTQYCLIMGGWNCSVNGSPCVGICGNSRREFFNGTGETCDDGNVVSGDGCSGICREEPGFNCVYDGVPCSCVYTNYGMWSSCSSCEDVGTKIRNRTQADVLTPSPFCIYLSDTKDCNYPCPSTSIMAQAATKDMVQDFGVHDFITQLNLPVKILDVDERSTTPPFGFDLIVSTTPSNQKRILSSNDSDNCFDQDIVTQSQQIIITATYGLLQNHFTYNQLSFYYSNFSNNSCTYSVTIADSPTEKSNIPSIVGIVVGLVALGVIILLVAVFVYKLFFKKYDVSRLPAAIRWQYELCIAQKDYHGSNSMGYFSKVLSEKSPEYDKAKLFFENALHGKQLEIKNIIAIYNPTLVTSFINTKTIFERRFSENSALFDQRSWQKNNDPLRDWVYQSYKEKAESYPWNEGAAVHILPVIHGTSIEIAFKIVETGFANLSSLDVGWYGKGIYFTSHALYAIPYFSTKRIPAVVISYIIPGNIYPVTEDTTDEKSLSGAAIMNGYNSHYVLTVRDGHIPPRVLKKGVYDEIVIPQESQIAPAFIIQVEFDNKTLQNWQRDTALQKMELQEEGLNENDRVSTQEINENDRGSTINDE